MGFMVIHLWGKFLMAAWRGRRALTWITGAVAFLASVGTAFTGYLHPAELRLAVDRDAGQGRPELGRRRRLLQRDGLRPDADVAHRAAAAGRRRDRRRCTCCWCAERGVVPPFPRRRPTGRRRAAEHRGGDHAMTGTLIRRPRPGRARTRHLVEPAPVRPRQGVRDRARGRRRAHRRCSPWCSPRRTRRPSRSRSWANRRPTDFVATALTELDGTSGTASTAPPYNTRRRGQKIGPLSLQNSSACATASTPAQQFVLTPLSQSGSSSAVLAAVRTYDAATATSSSSGRRRTARRSQRHRAATRPGCGPATTARSRR